MLQLSRQNTSAVPLRQKNTSVSFNETVHPAATLLVTNATLGDPLRQSPILHAIGPLGSQRPTVSSAIRPQENATLMGSNHKEDLPFFGPTEFPLLDNPEDPSRRMSRRMKEKELGREAVFAAALIMVLISFSVGLQLIMVEFVMTGTCAIPCNIAGMILAVILAVTAALRAVVRMLLRPFRPCWLLLWSWTSRNRKASPIMQALPEHLLEEVVGFLDLEGMCGLGSASRKSKDLVNSDACYRTLKIEVTQNGLEARWLRHLQRYKEQGLTRFRTVKEGDDPEDTATDTEAGLWSARVDLRHLAVRGWSSAPSSPVIPDRAVAATRPVPPIKGFPARPAEQPQVPQYIIQEMRRFLCRHVRRTAAKAEADEVNERWIVITDVVRYCMLVVGWFWFSAEVMDMACLEGGGPWQVIKAVTSPCLFIFILESDRRHFWWQVLAGLVAAAFLLDLLFA